MLRLWIAVWIARVVGWVSRRLGKGGSSLPGLVARRINPGVLTTLSGRLAFGALMLTGTNGKTTTAAMIRHVALTSGRKVVANQAGANLIRGLTAAFVQASSWHIIPRADWALLETDEATMPRAAQEIRPRMITVTNFFRDQLDRYGELSTTVGYVRQGIDSLREDGVLILNADDPQVAGLGRDNRAVWYYGLDAQWSEEFTGYDTQDARFCPRCGTRLHYERRYYAHLGHYQCPHCHFRRPTPRVSVTRWNRSQERVWMVVDGVEQEFFWRTPGIYNLYNEAAAVATLLASGVATEDIRRGLESFRPAFGRMEAVAAGAAHLWLALVKNPVGFNQVLATMAQDADAANRAMIVINDRYADGQDVSWLWDVDFEYWVVHLNVQHWYVSGVRARDMAVRLKYAGVEADHMTVQEESGSLLDRAVNETGSGTLYILPTYTAMLEVRQHLTNLGLVRHFREG